jgi:hypothetical protein
VTLAEIEKRAIEIRQIGKDAFGRWKSYEYLMSEIKSISATMSEKVNALNNLRENLHPRDLYYPGITSGRYIERTL